MTEPRRRGQPPKAPDVRREPLRIRLPAAFLHEVKATAAARGLTVTQATEQALTAWLHATADA